MTNLHHDPKAAPKRKPPAAADENEGKPKPKPKPKPKGKPGAPAIGQHGLMEGSEMMKGLQPVSQRESSLMTRRKCLSMMMLVRLFLWKLYIQKELFGDEWSRNH